jgi:uncharacterized protein (DUF1778 family)
MEQQEERLGVHGGYMHARIHPFAYDLIKKVCQDKGWSVSKFIRDAAINRALRVMNGKDDDTSK